MINITCHRALNSAYDAWCYKLHVVYKAGVQMFEDYLCLVSVS